MSANSRQAGFTLVEIVVVTPILMLIVASLIVLFTSMLNSTNVANSRLNTIVNARMAANVIQGDVALTTEFLPTIDSASGMKDPYGPNNAGATWSYRSLDGTKPNRAFGFIDRPNVLITRTYATTTSTMNPNRSLVFFSGNGCTSSTIASNPALTINNIYFVRNNTLYRRTLLPSPRPTNLCATPFQKQTCPTDVPYPRNSICAGDDTILATNINYFEVQYAESTITSDMSDAYDDGKEGTLTKAQRVSLVVGSRERASGETTSSLTYLTMYKRN